jgi:hypothetical protein
MEVRPPCAAPTLDGLRIESGEACHPLLTAMAQTRGLKRGKPATLLFIQA